MEYNKKILESTGIFVWDNALSSEFCERCIQEFESTNETFDGLTGGGYNPDIKKSTDWHLSSSGLNHTLSSTLAQATREIEKKYHHIKELNLHYSGYQMQRSNKGEGYFNWHTDNNEQDMAMFRVIAPIFYLNDVESGGETQFKYQDINIKPEQGKLVIFPATWKYLHRGAKPLSNDKYIITCFGMSYR